MLVKEAPGGDGVIAHTTQSWATPQLVLTQSLFLWRNPDSNVHVGNLAQPGPRWAPWTLLSGKYSSREMIKWIRIPMDMTEDSRCCEKSLAEKNIYLCRYIQCLTTVACAIPYLYERLHSRGHWSIFTTATKWPPFCSRHISASIFLNGKACYFDWIFFEICSQMSNWQ